MLFSPKRTAGLEFFCLFWLILFRLNLKYKYFVILNQNYVISDYKNLTKWNEICGSNAPFGNNYSLVYKHDEKFSGINSDYGRPDGRSVCCRRPVQNKD